MKEYIFKPAHLPHLRPLHPTNEGGGHPLDRKPPPPKKRPKKKGSINQPHIQVHYPKGKEYLYPKSHPKYKPKKN